MLFPRTILVLVLISGCFVYSGEESKTLVLIDGSVMAADGDFHIEHNMLAFRTLSGDPILLSKNLIDWSKVAYRYPDLWELAYPGEKPPKQTYFPTVKQKPVAITSESLKEFSDKNQRRFGNDNGGSGSGNPVIEVITKGESVDLKAHLDSTRFTIIDFYADWCGPCRRITPQLEAIVKEHPDKVVLKKVDIVSWNTPVARQYNISSIPYLEFYDSSGKKVASGGAGSVLNKIKKTIK